MGVLESIKVKQINYPYWRTYQDFYEWYEQLCSLSATVWYPQLVHENANFKSLSKWLLDETLQGKGRELFEFGHTKLFMKNALL